MTGGAVRRDNVAVVDSDGSKREMNFSKYMPGLIMDELAQGEEPVPFDTSRMGVDFAKIEQAILHTFAWGNEIPPDILTMSFSKSHSAMVAANNELELAIKKLRADRVADFDQPIQTDWLISEVLQGRIIADGFLEAWRDPLQFDVFGAWISSEWNGTAKPRVDPLKDARAMELMKKHAWITNNLATRKLTNTSFSKNVRRIRKENEQLVEANQPLIDAEAEAAKASQGGADALSLLGEQIESLTERLDRMADNAV